MHGGDTLPLPLAMLLVFGAAKLMAELFERFRQPGIVGEILAGVLLGPSVLGWVTPNDTLKALADLGVMFLLFRVGLEVKSSELMKVGMTAAVVAMIGVIVPLGAGWALMRLWGYGTPESIFVGAAMVATSVGITAQVLSAKGVLGEKASRIILAAAVIDDVLGLIVLAVVSSLTRGRINIFEILLTAALALAFTVIVAKWGTHTVRAVVPHFESRMRAGEAQFNLAMVLLFALSVLAMKTGVAAIVGAFLAGMALGETVQPRVHDLSRGVNELLVPFFLAGIGLQMNLSTLANRSTVVLALLVLLLAIATKLIGCGLGALPLGLAGAVKVGFGMVPRGEVGMVVAQIGLSLKAISTPVYGVVVFMAVATTLITPLLLKFAWGPGGVIESPFADDEPDNERFPVLREDLP